MIALGGCLPPAAWQSPSVFHGFFKVNESSTKSIIQNEKSTNSVKSKLSREKRQRSQENQSTNIEQESQLNQYGNSNVKKEKQNRVNLIQEKTKGQVEQGTDNSGTVMKREKKKG